MHYNFWIFRDFWFVDLKELKALKMVWFWHSWYMILCDFSCLIAWEGVWTSRSTKNGPFLRSISRSLNSIAIYYINLNRVRATPRHPSILLILDFFQHFRCFASLFAQESWLFNFFTFWDSLVSGCTGNLKSQKLPPILQILRFVAFLCYNFQKSVGAQAPSAPTVTRSLLIINK